LILAMERTRAWTAAQRAMAGAAEVALADLETAAARAFAGTAVPAIKERMAALDQLIAAPAEDLRQPFAPRVATLRNKVDEFMASVRRELTNEAGLKIGKLQELLGSVSQSSPLSEIRNALEVIRPVLEQLVKLAEGASEASPDLPDSLHTRIKALQTKINGLEQPMLGLDKAEAALAAASDLTQFTEALKSFGELSITAALEAKTAAGRIPSVPELLSALLYDDTGMRRACLVREGKPLPLHPAEEAFNKKDFEVLQQIAEDTYLSEIYEITVMDGSGGTRILYCKNKPSTVPAGDSTPEDNSRFTGEVYSPKPGDVALRFEQYRSPRSFPETGGRTSLPELSAVSAFVALLNLTDKVDERVEKWTGSLLPLFGILVHSSQIPASVRFEIWLKLATIVERDVEGWALDLCPPLARDIRKSRLLPAIKYSTAGWMIPGDPGRTAPHAAFFKEIAESQRSREGDTTGYSAAVNWFLGAEQRVWNAGATYAGYVSGAGTLKLLPDAAGKSELWALDKLNDNKCHLIRRSGEGFLPPVALPPYTPVFIIPLNRQEAKTTLPGADKTVFGPFYREP
jgi:hypothetical protein